MKRFISLVLALVMLAGVCAFAAGCNTNTDDYTKVKEKGVLKVGMECNYAPFNWTQANSSDTAVKISAGGYADGYDVQIAKKIADALGVKVEIVKLEWEGLIDALNSGVIDCIIAGMSATADRKLSIDFSSNYYASELVVVLKKGSAYENATSIKDFSGAKITGQLGTFHYDVIDQMTGATKLDAMGDFPTMIVALQAGTIDGYISELPGAVSAQSSNSDLTYVQFESGKGFVASEDDIAVAIGVRKGSTLTSYLNAALAAISESERQSLMNWAVENQPVSD